MAEPRVVREPTRAPGADVALTRISGDAAERGVDSVAVEEPLEIRLNGWRWTVTMRTPGDDADLIVGLLASEGVVASAGEIDQILFTRHPDEPDLANLADVRLARDLTDLHARLTRHQPTSASCGLCGASTIEAIVADRPPLAAGPEVASSTIARLPSLLAAAQPVFRATGGLHAAALFDAGGALRAAREDIGRHNAVDKVLGWRLRSGAGTDAAAVLLVSGRASFEIVQKALVGRVPIVAAVSAPSSMAVALALRSGMTLAAFVRDGSLNVYAGAERLTVLARRLPPATISRSSHARCATFSIASASRSRSPTGRRSSAAERRRLVTLVADASADEFARYLTERVTARTGKPPRPLATRSQAPS